MKKANDRFTLQHDDLRKKLAEAEAKLDTANGVIRGLESQLTHEKEQSQLAKKAQEAATQRLAVEKEYVDKLEKVGSIPCLLGLLSLTPFMAIDR